MTKFDDQILKKQSLKILNDIVSAMPEEHYAPAYPLIIAGRREGAILRTYSGLIGIEESKQRGYFSKSIPNEKIKLWIRSGKIPAHTVKKIGRNVFFIEHRLRDWLSADESDSSLKGGEEKSFKDSQKKEATMLKWSEPGIKTKRSRLVLGANYSVIEDPLQNGHSYRLEIRGYKKDRVWIRLNKFRAKDRESAVEEAKREIKKRGGTQEIIEHHPKTAIDGGEHYTVAQMARLFLENRRKLGIHSYEVIEGLLNNRVVTHFAETEMRKIGLQHLEDYRDYRRQAVQDVTIKNELVMLSTLFNFAIKRKLYDGDNPISMKDLRLTIKERKRYMSEKEEKKLWPVLRDFCPLLKDLATFALNTAMRPHNIVNLTWDRINWDERGIFIPAEEHKQKGKDGHYLINDVALRILKHREKEDGSSELVFYRTEGGIPFRAKKITLRWIQRKWQEACDIAGIENLHFYDLKHTCLSRLAGKGANVFILKRISNHSETKSLEKYVKDAGLKEPALQLMNGK